MSQARRHRSIGFLLMIPAAVLAGEPRVCLASPLHAVTDLGTLGAVGNAVDMNFQGQVGGSSTTNGGETHGIDFSGGVLHDLGTLGGTTSTGWAVNHSGVITGLARTPAESRTPSCRITGGVARPGLARRCWRR
ncbi:hypothetical protein [Paludisphaera mucosa]|uniref:Uncharacterized protein n=1 Tax=Paludisphaera mucosa TaxID=3030827 RepID=A0ABT6F489_9BACT|nr:hypothetical protein [Paludisphaera mucosa]MDG3002400.1 hypothetical protein [Paludisphaera mucosa]